MRERMRFVLECTETNSFALNAESMPDSMMKFGPPPALLDFMTRVAFE